MKILIYLGSNLGNNKIYEQKALELADWISSKKYSMVYGGNSKGLMGVVAKRVKLNGGKVIGIMPRYLLGIADKFEDADEFIFTDDMQERKDKMREMSDVCIALPGGAGTLEEITEAYSLFKIKQSSNPCILYNVSGYYDDLKNMYDKMVEEGFLDKEDRQKLLFSDDFEQIEKFIKDMSVK